MAGLAVLLLLAGSAWALYKFVWNDKPGAAVEAVTIGPTPNSGRTRDWKITEVVQGNHPFDVKFTETSRGGPLRGGAEYQIDVTLNANAPAGTISEQITLKTNDTANPLIHVGVTVSPAPLKACTSTIPSA